MAGKIDLSEWEAFFQEEYLDFLNTPQHDLGRLIAIHQLGELGEVHLDVLVPRLAIQALKMGKDLW